MLKASGANLCLVKMGSSPSKVPGALSLLLLLTGACYAPLAYCQQNQSQLVLEQSILTRAIGIEAPSKLVGLLDTMPLGLVPRDKKSAKLRSDLWSLFFRGSMTKLARVPSPQPFILFYNPIADVAAIQGCKIDPVTRVMLCTQACAVPGEVLVGELPGSSPRWLVSSDPIVTLQRIAGARMRAFVDANPAGSPEVVYWRRNYCSSELQSASEKRLVALAAIVGKVDPRKILAASADYVRNSAEHQNARLSSNTGNKPDVVIDLLAHLKDLSVSGAASGPTGNWIIFWTPKHNGWHDAALFLATKPDGSMRIVGGRPIALSSLAP
jgi:hypothetical protein